MHFVSGVKGHLTTDETHKGDALTWRTFHEFIQAMGGYLAVFIVLLTWVLLFSALTFNNWWLSYWIEISGNRPYNETVDDQPPTLANDPELGTYLLVYLGSIALSLVLVLIKSVIYTKLMLKASSTLHRKLFHAVMRSPMSFFDTTPTGRILNRFAKDMDEIDVMLAFRIEMTMFFFMVILSSLITISVVFPYFIIVFAVVIVVFCFIFQFYRRGVNDMKQLENVSRSPWFSHIGSTATGLATIHAYNKTDEAIAKFIDLLDVNAWPHMLFRMSTRWAGARLEVLVILAIVVTDLLAVLSHGVLPAPLIALAVAFAMRITGTFQLAMAMASESEARFLSAERMLQYIRILRPEAADETLPGKAPSSDWPNEGKIRFDNYSLRYRENLPLVLKKVTFEIRAGERVGIVGRTGSGKSSLSVALFRLVEADQGRITVDGVDISELGLFNLRSKMSIIPQDPVMFIGTIRYNLDPFNERSDEELWMALESAYMKDKISSLRGGLDAPVTEGGDNFSVGERQLLCMARALLRNSKILFLDEATAAIDTETDSLIQETIRSAFSDCTTLTIAHRLNTVLDSDRILVMDDGKVAEFDAPSALRSDPSSIFSKMLAATKGHDDK